MQILIDTNKPLDHETLKILSEVFNKSGISGVVFTAEDRKGISKRVLDQHLTEQGLMFINHFATKKTLVSE